MKIVDLHSDIFTDIAFRRAKGERRVFERIHLPKLQAGGIAGIIGVFWVEPFVKKGKRKKRFKELVNLVMDDLKESSVSIVSTPESLLEAYEQNDPFIYLGIEGLGFLEEWDGENNQEKISNGIHELDQRLVKHSSLTWNETNFIASGADNRSTVSGLRENGKYTIQQLEKNRWLIDVSHLNDASFWDIVHLTNMPLLASHSNARSLCAHQRNLTDEQLKAVAESGGLIGLNAYGSFVDPNEPTLEKFVDHIIHIADVAGIDHVGFGFDFVDYLQNYDLGSEMSNLTKGLENATKVPDLLDAMVKRGFSTEDIEKIAFKNFYNLLCNYHSKSLIGGIEK